MSNTPEISQARRVLLERYLHGDLPEAAIAVNTQESPLPLTQTSIRAPVVAIQTGGSKRPFFFLHGDWRNRAYWCFPLARVLGEGQPFYALEPYNFDGLPVPPSLETIAAAHLASMRNVQPEGPYLLGGFCNGGLLAYEMARQLHAEGQKLDLLVLMDPVPIGCFYPIHHRLARAILSNFGKLLRLRQEQQMYIYITLQHLSCYLRFSHYRKAKVWPWIVNHHIEHSHNEKGFVRLKFDALFPPVVALRQHYSAIYDWSALRYRPSSPYPGKITLFWPSEEPQNRKGWCKVIHNNETEAHIIPGTQMESRTQYLSILAEHLRRCLSMV